MTCKENDGPGDRMHESWQH